MFGIINLNKPRYLSSNDALHAVRRVLREASGGKVGHAGTLDPMATGVLAICVGPATRLVPYLQKQPKSYIADFQLGVTSSTEDRTGEMVDVPDAPKIAQQELEAVLPQFIGDVEQVPPRFSALKVNGKRAYRLARAGKEVDLKSRTIRIHELELLKFDFPEFRLRIKCGSGTYVRSLGRDIGIALNTGAVMIELERTSIGSLHLSNSVSPDDIDAQSLPKLLNDPAIATEGIRTVEIAEEFEVGFRDGKFLQSPTGCDQESELVGKNSGRMIAILNRFDRNWFKPHVNFSHYWAERGGRHQSSDSA